MFGAILSAITGIPALIDAGTALYNEIAGKPTQAKTADALVADVQALPADQQKAWSDAMQAKIDLYKAESARIQNEQGDVTADLLKVLDPKAAATVAILRMTTRPRVVLMMAHVIMLPVYVTILDVVLMMLNGIYRAFSGNRNFAPFDLFAEKLFGEGSIYVVMYQWSAPTAAAVVMTYITAKTYEAVKNGPAAGDGIAGTISKAVTAVGGLVGAVKGARGK